MLSVRCVRKSCLGASGSVGVEFSLMDWMRRPLSPSAIPELLWSFLSSNCYALESACEEEVMELWELI